MPRSTTDKSGALLALIGRGLQLHAAKATADTLGDRSRYVGMSDIGAALECPRAALARKVRPDAGYDLQRQLILQRGHWLEHGISQALAANKLNILSQLELKTDHQGTPVQAHPDFVLVWDKPRPAVRILELKSAEQLPETLYAGYEAQVYGQIGLLDRLWSEPAFNRRTFPELCRERFGIALPEDPAKVDMEAWVLCVSMSEARAYGPYLPDSAMLNLCLDTAARLWERMRAYRNGSLCLNDLDFAKGFHPLCSYCNWNADCPKFANSTHQPELQPALEKLALLREKRERLDAEIESIESGLKTAYACSSAKGWISAGSYRFKVSQQAGRLSLNKDRLRMELMDLTGSDDEAERIISACENEGKPFQRLTISPVNLL